MLDKIIKYVKAFKLLEPPTYAGNSDPCEAEDWLRRVTKCLEIIKVLDDLQVELATLMLTGDAERWWEFTKIGHGPTGMSWANFKHRFRNRYFPSCLERPKAKEFALITQGNMNVSQYVTKFIQLFLSRYEASMVELENKKIRNLIMGLRPSIRSPMGRLKFDTFEDAVNEALKIEMRDETNI
ncbi:hypothetical protein L484_013468 [Morus notabilis]|uniref:Retrotransposon gag domain-containing protein n=1 Tax=Morus notabilis TaxID=981085 RepID=W9QNP4_9ROSA|nr:uncharacterized protein LOC21396640 [Morus notabilis]EXB29694.1 hypothetical protein L484_013468 [Morus notabilis]